METFNVESLKFGEALPIGNPEPSPEIYFWEGVETRRATPKLNKEHGEGIVQTTNLFNKAYERCSGKKICRS